MEYMSRVETGGKYFITIFGLKVLRLEKMNPIWNLLLFPITFSFVCFLVIYSSPSLATRFVGGLTSY